MRAFVAVEVTEPAILKRIEELQRILSPLDPKNVKYVNTGNIHFTLQFLGQVPDGAHKAVADALRTVRFGAFDLEIGSVGAFPNYNSPRTVWVGGRQAADGTGRDARTNGDDATGLPMLSQKVSGVLDSLGYRRDKPFRPHSTIFRIKRGRVDIAEKLRGHSKERLGIQRVDNFKLKESRLTPEGPIYTDVATITATKAEKR